MNAISGLSPSSNIDENTFMSGSLTKPKEEKEEKRDANVDVSKKLSLSLLRQSSISSIKYEFHPVKLQKVEKKAKSLEMGSFKNLKISEVKKVVNRETTLE